MAGFSNNTMYADNVNFAGGKSPTISTDGQLLIGDSSAPNIKVGTLTSPGGSVTIGYSSPNITLEAASSPSPASTLRLIDDFIASVTDAQLAWQLLGTVFPIDGTNTHPGLYELASLPNSQGMCLCDSGITVASFEVGGGLINLNFVISLVTLSEVANRYTANIGLVDVASFGAGVNPLDGIYFSYSDNVNAGNWLLNCTSSSVTSSVDSGIAAGTGFVNLGISINAAGTSVSFTINGVSVGTPIVTNIPSAFIAPTMLWVVSAGDCPQSLIDLFYLTKTLTVSR